jgi:hypothetical protein
MPDPELPAPDAGPERWTWPGGGWCALYPGWLSAPEADAALPALTLEIPWRQNHIRIAGKSVAEPRLSSWHGDPEVSYRYSGVLRAPEPWTPTLDWLRERVASHLGAPFNSVLANRYRDGRDAMGMHADDERELGPTSLIASVSLGMTRSFVLVPKKGRAGERQSLRLTHGSLLVMGGTLQQHCKHGVPREAHVFQPRLNLTFRWVQPLAPR